MTDVQDGVSENSNVTFKETPQSAEPSSTRCVVAENIRTHCLRKLHKVGWDALVATCMEEYLCYTSPEFQRLARQIVPLGSSAPKNGWSPIDDPFATSIRKRRTCRSKPPVVTRHDCEEIVRVLRKNHLMRDDKKTLTTCLLSGSGCEKAVSSWADPMSEMHTPGLDSQVSLGESEIEPFLRGLDSNHDAEEHNRRRALLDVVEAQRQIYGDVNPNHHFTPYLTGHLHGTSSAVVANTNQHKRYRWRDVKEEEMSEVHAHITMHRVSTRSVKAILRRAPHGSVLDDSTPTSSLRVRWTAAEPCPATHTQTSSSWSSSSNGVLETWPKPETDKRRTFSSAPRNSSLKPRVLFDALAFGYESPPQYRSAHSNAGKEAPVSGHASEQALMCPVLLPARCAPVIEKISITRPLRSTAQTKEEDTRTSIVGREHHGANSPDMIDLREQVAADSQPIDEDEIIRNQRSQLKERRSNGSLQVGRGVGGRARTVCRPRSVCDVSDKKTAISKLKYPQHGEKPVRPATHTRKEATRTTRHRFVLRASPSLALEDASPDGGTNFAREVSPSPTAQIKPRSSEHVATSSPPHGTVHHVQVQRSLPPSMRHKERAISTVGANREGLLPGKIFLQRRPQTTRPEPLIAGCPDPSGSGEAYQMGSVLKTRCMNSSGPSFNVGSERRREDQHHGGTIWKGPSFDLKKDAPYTRLVRNLRGRSPMWRKIVVPATPRPLLYLQAK